MDDFVAHRLKTQLPKTAADPRRPVSGLRAGLEGFLLGSLIRWHLVNSWGFEMLVAKQ